MILLFHWKKLTLVKNKIFNFQLPKDVLHVKVMAQNQVLVLKDVHIVVVVEK